MKNNFYRIIMTVMAVLFTAMPSFASKLTPEMKTVMSKFGLAMGGVVAFSLILYIGLSLYNKFFVGEQIKDFKLRKDSLRTPADKDEAVMMFIAKNRLR
ncbi:hypothetical protein IJ674_08020 [bacterium]|nr:hypothetical protein [bacterium]MBR1619823.1 hypothetical protein [bacterium]